MPTLLICQECGGVRGAIETTDAGPPCHCAHPSPSSTVYGSAPGMKICCICGTDVGGQRRMKDREGRYFCYDCGLEDSKRKHGSAIEQCADCHRPLSTSSMKYIEGKYVCDKCQANRIVRAKREAARIAYAAQGEQERKRRIVRNAAIAAVLVVVIAVLIVLMAY